MSDRIKFLVQKRTSLKSQITSLANLFDKGRIDNTTLKLRSARLTELYHAYEEYNDELAVLDPEGGHQDEFANVQERFYSIVSRIESSINATATYGANASGAGHEARKDDSGSVASVVRRRIKLPEAPLPTFGGTRADLSDIDKLHYLRSALTDDAANKIKIFTVDGINYSEAWDLLERSYEQHLASLKVLGVSVGSEIVVHLLESKLPKCTLEKWEATLERDQFPQLDEIYEFLYKTAVCASKRERSKIVDSEKRKGEPPVKKRHVDSNKAFVLSTSRGCIMCKTKRHPLYLCDKFKRLPIPKRIEAVREAKICYNCLRSHRDRPCKFSNCTICQKRHNTLLHLDGYATTGKSDATRSSDTPHS
ncbi:hypothetical protein ALC57_04941 [Trachymyrmex cornetzi]|uniref:DUF1758 domain-containing protein n=1 Tax=Trachymyrmex cornetzi TaxID=471704 RepID=A0A151JBW9_9HYME|nr:hypothetical protein ALC57_04941 [Trachymyrmex cornetzi]